MYYYIVFLSRAYASGCVDATSKLRIFAKRGNDFRQMGKSVETTSEMCYTINTKQPGDGHEKCKKRIIEEYADTLKTLAARLDTSKTPVPSFMMAVTGTGNYAYRRKGGIFVVPITTMKN